jgi:hypothetical protein
MNDTLNILDIIRLSVNTKQPSITISSSWMVLAIIALVTIIYLIIKRSFVKNKLRWQTLEIEISGTPKATFKVERNFENLFIANRIYIELTTRKAAILFDEENDVIEEIYNSWYKLFGIIRDEIKAVPGKYLHDHDATQSLIGLTEKILNEGLRPHLTKYQAKYRKWLKNIIEKPENENKTPQQIQKNYPEYNELVISMKEVNKLLIDYSKELDKLIKGKV